VSHIVEQSVIRIGVEVLVVRIEGIHMPCGDTWIHIPLIHPAVGGNAPLGIGGFITRIPSESVAWLDTE